MKRDTLSRLIQILVLIQGRGLPNAQVLAEHCRVSRRTIHRDLQRLEEAGVPILYHVQKQGYCLDPGAGLGSSSLNQEEAFALILAVQTSPVLEASGLMSPARRGLEKLIQGFSETTRDRMATVVEVCGDAGIAPPRHADQRLVREILDAIARNLQVRITFRSSEQAAPAVTKVAIFRLLWRSEGFVLVGRSSVHRGVIRCPLSAIQDLAITEDASELPHRFRVPETRGLGEDSEESIPAPVNEAALGIDVA